MGNPARLQMSECLPPANRCQRGTSVHRAFPQIPRLGETDIHVYCLSLTQPPLIMAQLASTLSIDERQRAGRFHFEVHSSRFIAGRGLLRLLLAHHLHVEPAEINFSYRAAGKPELRAADAGLHFNLAHCEDCALLAITRLGPVGVDLERVRDLPDFEELVGRFFSVREATAFARLLPAQKPQAFFNLWTRKEAWLKAVGDGIAQGLDKVEVTFLPGETARLLAIPPGDAPEHWNLRELQPAAGFVGALGIRQSAFSLLNLDFSPLP